MCHLHKKALQPAHPSEPRLGQFINNPGCRRCVPIYPLRYAIADVPYESSALPQLGTRGYPVLKGGKHYGLRLLRPGSYVYLFYFKDGRMWTQHYQVTENALFAALWWGDKDYDDVTPGRHAKPHFIGATAYIPAPVASTAESVWLMVSDTLLSHCTLWQIEQDSYQLRSLLATPVKPTGGAEQKHSLPASHLVAVAPELNVPPSLMIRQRSLQIPSASPFQWSESQPRSVSAGHINQEMRLALRHDKEVVALAVVLQDPFGITSELNHLATTLVQAKAKFAADNAHKLSSAQLINSYFQQASTPAQAETRARQQALVQLSAAQRFPATYAAQINTFETPIENAVDDAIAWVVLCNPGKPLELALRCFDLNVIHNARGYEEAVFQCLGALVHTQEGRRILGALIDSPAQGSHYWRAVTLGNLELLARLNNTLTVSRGVFDVVSNYLEEHAATPATNALISLLQAVPTAYSADIMIRRLQHVLEVRFNATLIQHEVSAAQYLRFARELQGSQTLGPELIARWNLPAAAPIVEQTFSLRVPIYEWVKVGETDYAVIDKAPASRPALPAKRAMPLEGNPLIRSLERLRGPAGHLFTGVGGVLAVLGMGQGIQTGIKEHWSKSSLAGVIGASSALIGAGIEIGATGIAVAAANRGNAVLATSVKALSAKIGIAYFGAGGVALTALSDGIKTVNAVNDLNSEQAKLYLGTALAGGTLTLATWAGGTATAASITNVAAGGGTVAVLGLTPAGWAVIALVAIGSGIYLALQADDAKHGPVDIWLKHSAWGLHQKRYTHKQELEAFYNLLYRPRLSAQWDQSFGYDVGTLTISCLLPNSMMGERFAWDMRITLDGQRLSAVEGPIMHASGTHPIDYRRQYLITRGPTLGAERGWTISMHEDAQVAVEYLYQPNPQEQPDLALSQPGAPEPLIFTAGGWFSDPIDENKVAPVEAPK